MFKSISRIICPVIAFYNQLVDKRIKTEMFFKLSYLNSNLGLTLGYLNPALNNSAQSLQILHGCAIEKSFRVENTLHNSTNLILGRKTGKRKNMYYF